MLSRHWFTLKFELRHGDRKYEPLGLHAQLFLDIFGKSVPIPYVKLKLVIQILRALEFIHSVQVIHSGLTSSDNTLCRLIHLGL
jgi:hypothetical protein